ncbi:hypothetical protein A4X09_0g1202 [Tilletia walkeri]|uniref:Glycoside hydrolase n=1 Tax=Tilletia walkeri TaxID=117179 RepID=A0A8X7T8A0_9BASI|nr:hypothetical protein A4X09_0g1202 [Tilletia walkeri]
MAHRIPERSPVTDNQLPPHYLHASDAYFRDSAGRACLLRGVNLSGSSKAPLNKPSQESQGFWEDAEQGGLSFVGRPLGILDGSADIHLARLKSWGFNSFRYVFTWEALEHQGPGKYDHEFIQYTVDVLRKIKQYGFRVYMDPHQDLFSRFTGGSGAPYWVLPACGMNPRNFTPTQAALIHSEWPSQESPSPIDFPDMIWATNYTRLAAATLSVLFFAGRDFAPKCIIDGINIQDWLQGHFIKAVTKLAEAIAAADDGGLLDSCVIGWDSMNEPNPTYIGLPALNKLPAHWKLRKGPMPTPLQSFITGAGKAQEIDNYIFGPVGPKKSGSSLVDPKGKSIWMTALEDHQKGGSRWGWARHPDWPLGQCLWAAHGVWNQSTGELLNSTYFSKFGGPKGTRNVEFVEDYWLPHWRAYSAAIRPIHPEAIMFLQPPVFEPPPKGLTADDLRQRACVSSHFYDGLTLITKHWNWFNADAVGLMRGKYLGVPFALRFGYKAIRQCMRDQLGYLRSDTLDVLGQYPTIIGEIGIPFDLDKRKAYYGDEKGRGQGDFSAQSAALDASINACDGKNLLSYSLWTYCPDNTHKWGDGWNGEDLSLWGLDDVKKIPSSSSNKSVGGRRRGAEEESGSNVNLLAPPSTMEGLLTDSTSSLDPTSIQGSSSQPSPSPTFRLDFGSAGDPNSLSMGLPALSNGARSAAAFVRPYPVACNGVPIEINFDIKTSEFEFVLEVDSQDLGVQPSSSSSSKGGLVGRDGKEFEDGGSGRSKGVAPTEIFLPFIHYARDGNGAGAMGNFDARVEGVKRGKKRAAATATAAEQGAPSAVGETQLAISASSSSSASASASASASRGSMTPQQQAAGLTALDSIEYDVEVEVSAGTWEVRDQYLYWSLPASAGEVDAVRKVLEAAEIAAAAAEQDEGGGGRQSSRSSKKRNGGGANTAATAVESGTASIPLSRTGSSSGQAKSNNEGTVVEVREADESLESSQVLSSSMTSSSASTTIPTILPTITDEGKVQHRIRIVRRTGAVRASRSSSLTSRSRFGFFLRSLRRDGGSGDDGSGPKRRFNMLIVIALGIFLLAALALLVALLATLRHRHR